MQISITNVTFTVELSDEELLKFEMGCKRAGTYADDFVGSLIDQHKQIYEIHPIEGGKTLRVVTTCSTTSETKDVIKKIRSVIEDKIKQGE